MKFSRCIAALGAASIVVSGVSAHAGNHGQHPLAVEKAVEDAKADIYAVDDVYDTVDVKHEPKETYITYIFNKLFPFGPAGNAILATTYISGPPNLLLALIPANIDMSSLSLLVSFAIGGLLGDVFLHLLPETFTGQSVDLVVGNDVYVLVDDRKNVVLGIGMFIGFLLFFMIDKSMRIMEGNDGGEGHSHGHSHSHNTSVEKENPKDVTDDTINSSIKTSAYLNLISDFTHNITDGLAISSSFYISKNVGCTTAIATFMHEIPHEVGDFALLIQGGFSKWQAMCAQFVTAAGAFLGTFIGIALQSGLGKDGTGNNNSNTASIIKAGEGIWGTSLSWGDMTLPFTAGGFFYIAFNVIPELLEGRPGASRREELWQFVLQLACMFAGIGFMVVIALNE
jgi:zinc transporter 7